MTKGTTMKAKWIKIKGTNTHQLTGEDGEIYGQIEHHWNFGFYDAYVLPGFPRKSAEVYLEDCETISQAKGSVKRWWEVVHAKAGKL